MNAYTLMFGGFLLLGGRFADRLGRRRIFTAGLALFVLASIAGGAAQSPGTLILARAIQGVGGALMAPAALSLLTVIFEEGPERNRALGVWGAIAAGGAAIGVLLGGLLVEYLNWRWVFFVNIPVGVLALAGAARFVPESRDDTVSGFDVAGAVTVTAGLVALVYALVRGNDVGWATAETVGTLLLSAGLLMAFYTIEAQGHHPLLPLRIFRNRNVTGSDIAILLVGAGMFGMFFYISLYLQQILHYSAIKTGLCFLPVTFVIMTSAGVGSQLLTKLGPRRVASAGMLVASLGMLVLIRVHPGGSYLGTVLLPLVIIGAGLGPAFVSLTAAAVSGVPSEDSGLASALLNTGQQVGGSLGLALLTAVSQARTNQVITTSANAASAITSGWAWGFAVCAALLATGAMVSGTVIRASKEDVATAPQPVPVVVNV